MKRTYVYAFKICMKASRIYIISTDMRVASFSDAGMWVLLIMIISQFISIFLNFLAVFEFYFAVLYVGVSWSVLRATPSYKQNNDHHHEYRVSNNKWPQTLAAATDDQGTINNDHNYQRHLFIAQYILIHAPSKRHKNRAYDQTLPISKHASCPMWNHHLF